MVFSTAGRRFVRNLCELQRCTRQLMRATGYRDRKLYDVLVHLRERALLSISGLFYEWAAAPGEDSSIIKLSWPFSDKRSPESSQAGEREIAPVFLR